MGARSFDRPDLDQRRKLLALYVTGPLLSAKPSLAYRGTLQIHNQIGACTVEQIDGDQLPPGSSLSVEGDKVVITWPAYQATGVVPIFNGNLEQGDVGWEKGAGWTIENVGSGNDGRGSKVAVYRGQGESVMEGVNYYPCTVGQPFNAQLDVQQGASSANNVGACVGVRFYNQQKQLLVEQRGNMVWSGENGQWHLSNLAAEPPPGTAFARPVYIANRRRENKRLWVDDGTWTLQAVVGINFERDFALTLRVRDSGGRSFTWAGTLRVKQYVSPVRFDLSTAPADGLMTLQLDGTAPRVVSGSAFVIRAVRSAALIPNGDWYFESDTRGINSGGAYLWGQIGVVRASTFNNAVQIGTGAGTANAGGPSLSAGETWTWYPHVYASSFVGSAFVWDPGAMRLMRLRHRITVSGGVASYQIAVQDGPWIPVFSGLAGPFAAAASVRGLTDVPSDPANLYAQARLISLPTEFAYGMPSGCEPLAGIVAS